MVSLCDPDERLLFGSMVAAKSLRQVDLSLFDA